jgi:hypothetical protein
MRRLAGCVPATVVLDIVDSELAVCWVFSAC